MIDALRRLWNGSDLPRGPDGQLRKPPLFGVAVRGVLRGPHAERLAHAPPQANSTYSLDWGSTQSLGGMTRLRFEAMDERNRLMWLYGLRGLTTTPRHHAQLINLWTDYE